MKWLSLAVIVGLLAFSSPQAAGGGQQRPAAKPEPDLCAVPPGAQPLLPATLLPGMGDTTRFPVTTTSEEARRFFLQGVAQIHSFWFQESERSCLQAADLDPEMAMAHWCIAVSAAGDYRPAFQLMRDPNDGGRANITPAAPPPNPEAVARTTNGSAIDAATRAREAATKAMTLRSKVTPRERLYIEAQAARRAPGSRDAADAAYISGMRTLVTAFPDDLEAKSMLALAIDNGYDASTKEPRANTMESIRLMEEIVAADDDNFGAHHYLIHAWEGSRTPEKAWRANERYPALVPNIPHALHMPGHIYAQSDRVDDAIEAFTVAANNELKWINADSLYPNGHHGHNVHFLIHSLNLAGRYDESLKWVQHLFTFRETPRERAGNSQRVVWRQGYFGLIKTLVRFERWNEILDGKTIPVHDKPEQQAWRLWAVGLAEAATGKYPAAKQTLAEMQKHVAAATGTGEPLKIAALELEASISARADTACKRSHPDAAGKPSAERVACFRDYLGGIGLFAQAAARESSLIYTEPPSYPRPVHEGWANVALATGDFNTAEWAYRAVLQQEPGSGRANFGRAAALDALGRRQEARELRVLATKAWAKADATLPQLQSQRTSAQ